MSATPELAQEVLFVSCDICVEVKTPALKTCLKCEISMCAQHLQTHLTTPVLLQSHPLTIPVQTGSASHMASKCSAHGKLVEYYCLNDHVLVCMSCAIEEGHRLHNMKTLQTAHRELVDKLNEEMNILDQRQNQAKELEMWHEDQTQTLKKSVSQLMETGSALKDLVFTSLQTSVSARLGALQTAKQAISSALKEEDHFIFLQKFASVHKAIEDVRIVDLKQGLESEPDCEKLIGEIKRDGQNIAKQLHGLQRKFLAFADPEFHPFAGNEPNVSDLTFDPKTLGPGMTLSKDLKTLFYNSSATKQTPFPEAPCRTKTVRCQQINDGSLRWLLNLSEDFDWTIGLCDFSARDGNYSYIHGLMKDDNCLYSLQTNDVQHNKSRRSQKRNETLTVSYKFHVSGPWKVEVIWDDVSNLLTFYSRNKATKGLLLCKLRARGYSRGLYPFITINQKTSTRQYRSQSADNSFTEILCELKNN